MSHWAEIDKNNIVIRVIVGDNNDPVGDEGYQWLIDNLGSTWIKTSYNAATNGFRYNYAGIGYKYLLDEDAFLAPKPTCGHTELMINAQKMQWQCQRCELDDKARLSEQL